MKTAIAVAVVTIAVLALWRPLWTDSSKPDNGASTVVQRPLNDGQDKASEPAVNLAADKWYIVREDTRFADNASQWYEGSRTAKIGADVLTSEQRIEGPPRPFHVRHKVIDGPYDSREECDSILKQ